MRTWKIAEAKAQFSAVIEAAKHEPQIICNRDAPVGAILNMAEYGRLKAAGARESVPRLADLLDELRAIQAEEAGEIAVPARRDRSNPADEARDELSG